MEEIHPSIHRCFLHNVFLGCGASRDHVITLFGSLVGALHRGFSPSRGGWDVVLHLKKSLLVSKLIFESPTRQKLKLWDPKSSVWVGKLGNPELA